MNSGTRLTGHVDELIAAVANRDSDGYRAALDGIANQTMHEDLGEVRVALTRLVPVLAESAVGIGCHLAPLAGAMADHADDPAIVLPTLTERAAVVMERAAHFAALHQELLGDPPEPDTDHPLDSTLERFTAAAATRGITAEDAYELVIAWFRVDYWAQPVLFLCQRKDVRAMLPQRERLLAAVAPVRDRYGTTHWLHEILLVVDDEPLVVLDRLFAVSGRGFRVTISGIGDNFQLHTMLAAALVGAGSVAGLPGRRPTATEIAAATDGEDLTPAGRIRGTWNLADAYGEWIWNEGRPADIPMLDGVRVVVLDREPYERTWTSGRPFPLMRPELTVDAELAPIEVANWLGRIKPASTR
jgi:hypothetical protein